MKKVAQGYFASHPSIDTFFLTSDEQAFFTKQAAENHASSLAKELREITEVTRVEAEGDDTKVAAANAKAVEKATAKVEALTAKLTTATEKADAENDEVKKQKLVLAVTTAQALVDEATKELEAHTVVTD
jgi:hypothetical protein